MTRYRYATPRPVSDDYIVTGEPIAFDGSSPVIIRLIDGRVTWATPRPDEDVLTRVPRRTGAPQSFVGPAGNESRRGAPYLQAYPRMAHQVRPEPLPADRSRIAPDLLALAVILAVVLAASLVGVRIP